MPDITVKGMYHLAPLIKLPETIDLPATSGPNTMYRVEPLVQVRDLSSRQAVRNGVCNGLESNSSDDVQQLSARQEAVMQRLQGLQQQLAQLKAVQDRKNAATSVSSPVTDVPQFKVLSSQQCAVVAGLTDLRKHLVMLLQQQHSQTPERNIDFSISEDKSSEVTKQHVCNEQQQLLERLHSLRSQIITLRDSQVLEDESFSPQVPKGDDEELFTSNAGLELQCSEVDPIITGVSSGAAVPGCGTDANLRLLWSAEGRGVGGHSYGAVAETHSALLAILCKLREQVLQLPLLTPYATNPAAAASATPAVLEQQHYTVLHKLLLLQHRLTDVLLKQPGCPTWPPHGSEAGVCHDLVISASPLSPPYSVLAFAAALRTIGYTVLTTAAVHSSLDPETVPLALSSEFSSNSTGSNSRADHQVVLSLVWSAVPRVMLMVNPLTQCSISGEGNVLRYLSRLLPASSPYHYEGDASFAAIARTDLLLDDCTAVLAAAPGDKRTIGQFVKRMDEALKKATPGPSGPMLGAVGDVAVWSALRQLQERGTKVPPASLKWLSVVGNSIMAGLLLRARVSDALAQTPLASARPPPIHQEPGSTSISNKASDTSDQSNITSCGCDDHNFSEGFWSTSRPSVPEKCKDVSDLEENSVRGASFSGCKVIEDAIPRKETSTKTNSPKPELVAGKKSKSSTLLPDQDSGTVQSPPSSTDTPHQHLTTACSPRTDTVSSDGHVRYEGLVARMDQLGIKYQLRHHASVMTVDQLMENVGDMPGLHMKNLFLRDKKKKTLFLVCARHDAKVQLNKVGKQVGCRELRFTDRDVLYSMLGVEPGHVTAYALINDLRNVVTLILDEAVTYDKQQMVNFHPMVNTATLGMTARDLLSFIEFTGHKPLFMNFDNA